jgi:hypothetical protein
MISVVIGVMIAGITTVEVLEEIAATTGSGHHGSQNYRLSNS